MGLMRLKPIMHRSATLLDVEITLIHYGRHRSARERHMVNAQSKMKALVVSRLLLGDIHNWMQFEQERNTAAKIVNRHIARSVSSQIGRRYRNLSAETARFISNNFDSCGYDELARLCDAVKSGSGLYLRLDEFEKRFFPLAERVKRQFPFYAHVSISTYGLKFEFPEHHFLRDIETSLPELLDTRSRMIPFMRPDDNTKHKSDLVAGLVARERFLSRSIVSATFSLVEAFLSGLFFTAVHTRSFGYIRCDDEFFKYASTKESAPLKDRFDRIIRFVSAETENVNNEPFNTFIEDGKRYRDAIHHTTPFGRKDIEPGGRLTALYEINCEIALRCVELSSASLLKILEWTHGESASTDIGSRCSELLRKAKEAQNNNEVQSAVSLV